MTPEQIEFLRSLRGLVATVVTTGTVDEHFAQARENLRSFCDRNGFHAIEWRTFPAALVEAGRDEVVTHALKEGYDYVLQMDADAAPFQEDSLAVLLKNAYLDLPHADLVGAYCQLKSEPFLPTIDTGTGTWEPILPGRGLIPVIRTGGHFHLAKTEGYRKVSPHAPWYRTRQALGPMIALAEVDNYARCKLHGQNPFRDLPEWDQLVTLAKQESRHAGSVGEDSGFCDALLASGGQAWVNTDLIVGHVRKQAISPRLLQEALEERRSRVRAACGIGLGG